MTKSSGAFFMIKNLPLITGIGWRDYFVELHRVPWDGLGPGTLWLHKEKWGDFGISVPQELYEVIPTSKFNTENLEDWIILHIFT